MKVIKGTKRLVILMNDVFTNEFWHVLPTAQVFHDYPVFKYANKDQILWSIFIPEVTFI